MNRFICTLICLAAILPAAAVSGSGTGDYIKEAEKHWNEGEIENALSLLKKGVEENPGDPVMISYLGLYTGMSAGKTKNFSEAGRLANESFMLLDKAVSIDPEAPEVLMNRGIILVNVPEFLGKLDTGIADLEKSVELSADSEKGLPDKKKAIALTHLAGAYTKKSEFDRAISAWQEVINISPESASAEMAGAEIEKLSGMKNSKEKADPGGRSSEDSSKLISEGIEAYNEGDYSKARKLLSDAAEADPGSFDANKYLGLSIARLAEVGYDERIAEDTDLRTNLVMESVKYLDRAVDIKPDDIDLRYTRGSMLIYFPFFTGKLDQGIADLEMVLASGMPDSVKANTGYLLGVGYRKKGNHYWVDATVKYPKSDAARMIYGEMKPEMGQLHRNKQGRGTVMIDFVVGYRDELPPQIAVWIEDAAGNYIRTLYVSGFSGHVRDRQVVLPVWARSSEFREIDAVTGASIDAGIHRYTWDLRDNRNRRVDRGEYIVKVEGSFWPSYKYQVVEGKIRVGRKTDRVVVEEGDFIPWFKAEYVPE